MYGKPHWTDSKRLCLGIVTTIAKPMKMSGLPVLTNAIARYINVSWRPVVAWWRWYGLHMNTHMQSTCKYVKYMLNLGENMLAIVLYIVLLGEIWVSNDFGCFRDVCNIILLEIHASSFFQISWVFRHIFFQTIYTPKKKSYRANISQTGFPRIYPRYGG